MQERPRRIPADMAVTIIGMGRTTQARLLDVSRDGLKAAAANVFRPGQCLTVLAAGMMLEGQVRWTKGALLGVKLAVPLSPEQQAALAHGTRIA